MFKHLRSALAIVLVSLGVFYAVLSVFSHNYEGILIWCLVTYAGYRLHEIFALREDLELLNREIEILAVEVAILESHDFKTAKKISRKAKYLLLWVHDHPYQAQQLEEIIARLQVVLTSQK